MRRLPKRQPFIFCKLLNQSLVLELLMHRQIIYISKYLEIMIFVSIYFYENRIFASGV